MLLRKRHFAVIEAASKDGYSLNGICVEPGGRTVATDGYIAATVKAAMPDPEEFPPVEGMEGIDPAAQPDKPIILPGPSATAVEKAIPKRQTMPVLEHAVLGAVDGGKVDVASTDLERLSRDTVRLIDGEFPNWRQALPDGKAKQVIAIDARLLKRLLKVVDKFYEKTDSHGPKQILLRIYGPLKPVRIDARTDGDELIAVLMPMQPDKGDLIPNEIEPLKKGEDDAESK